MSDEDDEEIGVKTDPKSHEFAGYIEAFTILLKYGNGQGSIRAEHDEIYAGGDEEKEVSKKDVIRLAELGWHKCSEGGFQKFV
jgi:hypothetical protein